MGEFEEWRGGGVVGDMRMEEKGKRMRGDWDWGKRGRKEDLRDTFDVCDQIPNRTPRRSKRAEKVTGKRPPTNLVQSIQIPKAPLARRAVIRRVLALAMLLQQIVVPEDTGAVLATKPMLALLVLQTSLLATRTAAGPARVAPAAFELVGVGSAVVEMVADAVGRKVAAAAGWHGFGVDGFWIFGGMLGDRVSGERGGDCGERERRGMNEEEKR